MTGKRGRVDGSTAYSLQLSGTAPVLLRSKISFFRLYLQSFLPGRHVKIIQGLLNQNLMILSKIIRYNRY